MNTANPIPSGLSQREEQRLQRKGMALGVPIAAQGPLIGRVAHCMAMAMPPLAGSSVSEERLQKALQEWLSGTALSDRFHVEAFRTGNTDIPSPQLAALPESDIGRLRTLANVGHELAALEFQIGRDIRSACGNSEGSKARDVLCPQHQTRLEHTFNFAHRFHHAKYPACIAWMARAAASDGERSEAARVQLHRTLMNEPKATNAVELRFGGDATRVRASTLLAMSLSADIDALQLLEYGKARAHDALGYHVQEPIWRGTPGHSGKLAAGSRGNAVRRGRDVFFVAWHRHPAAACPSRVLGANADDASAN